MENDNKQTHKHLLIILWLVVIVAAISFLAVSVLVNKNNELSEAINLMGLEVDTLKARIDITSEPTSLPTPSMSLAPTSLPTISATPVSSPRPDTTGPVISVLEVKATGVDTARVKWSTNEPASSVVICDGNTHFESDIIGKAKTNFEAMISSLVSRTQYICYIKATDNFGNMSQSNNFNFVTY